MDIGVCIFPTAESIQIDELARELEARNFESLFVPEHTHIPASRRSPWPGGGDLPEQYWKALDPFIGLTAAAMVTKKLRIGMGICLLTERDPIVTAKEVATVDLLSGGRFEFGIGAGWNAEEMENHGTVFKDRFKVMTDRAKAIKVILSEDEAEYHGPFVDFDPIWSFPKPVQKPHPPILIGGETKYTLQRVVEWADGWIPRGRNIDPKVEMQRLREAADAGGRDPKTISTSVFAPPPKGDVMDECREAGMDRALLMLPTEGRDKVIPLLDEYAKLIL
ncbi:MAG: LLM class F420-dependent oxidoreductase [Gammaproteobacteria bacterium]